MCGLMRDLRVFACRFRHRERKGRREGDYWHTMEKMKRRELERHKESLRKKEYLRRKECLREKKSA